MIFIVQASKKLKNKFTMGDHKPRFLLRGCFYPLLSPLLQIFNLSLKTCTFSDVWKKSHVCPILKKGYIVK